MAMVTKLVIGASVVGLQSHVGAVKVDPRSTEVMGSSIHNLFSEGFVVA